MGSADQVAPREEPRAPASHGAEEVAYIIRQLRDYGPREQSSAMLIHAADALARLVRDVEELRKGYADSLRREGQACIERDKAEAEVENHENERRYDNAERDQLRADLATARERIEQLERLEAMHLPVAAQALARSEEQRSALSAARALLGEAKEIVVKATCFAFEADRIDLKSRIDAELRKEQP